MRRDEWTTGGRQETSSWERRRVRAAEHERHMARLDAIDDDPYADMRSAYTRRKTALFTQDDTQWGEGNDSGRRSTRGEAFLELDDGFVDPLGGGARSHLGAPQATGSMYHVERGASSERGRRNAQSSPRKTRYDEGDWDSRSDDSWGWDDYSGGSAQGAGHSVHPHAPVAGNYRARPSGLEAGSQRVSRTPGIALALAAVCVVLLVVFIVRAPGLADTFAQVNETNATLADQKVQLDKLKSTNAELQSSIDSMQATIDTYNAQKS